jgi:hypothetical protein
MNGRISVEETPEGRLAAVAKSLELEMLTKFEKTGVGPSTPDYADYRDALRPYVKQELLHVKEKLLERAVAQGRKRSADSLTISMKELGQDLDECRKELAEVQKQIPKEHRL